MMKLTPFVLGVSLAAGSMLAMAQDAAPKGPPILQITREWVKAGKTGMAHDKSEAAFVSALRRSNFKYHYIALNSLSGKARALYFTRYDSFADWENANKAQEQNAALSAEIDHAMVSDGDLLDGLDQSVMVYDEDLSYHSRKPDGKLRVMEVSQYVVKPGHRGDFAEIVKRVKASYDKMGGPNHWGAYHLMYGGSQDSYMILSGHESMADIDKGMGEGKKWMEAMGGEEGMKKFEELIASTIQSSHSELFVINPRQSYVEDDWVKADPAFWNPKGTETAKAPKPAKNTTATAKPAGQ